MRKFVLTILAATLIISASWAQQTLSNHASQSEKAATFSANTQQMGQFNVSIMPIDPSKTTVKVTVNDAGKPVPVGVVPLEIEYVARNVPFTKIIGNVSETSLLVKIPSNVTENYTLRLSLRWNDNEYQKRFFINRTNNNQKQGR